MSTQRPNWWPLYGDPVRCPIRGDTCCRFKCVTGFGSCEARDAMALVPKDEEKPT